MNQPHDIVVFQNKKHQETSFFRVDIETPVDVLLNSRGNRVIFQVPKLKVP